MFQITTRLRARRRRKTRGQGLVEFALILPILMLFFVTVLDLGRVAATQVALTNAAREGAFQAAKTPDSFDASNPCPADGSSNKIWCRIKMESGGGASINSSDVSVSCAPAACTAPVASDSTVTVRVSGHFTLFTPLMGAFFGGQDVTVSASSTVHREWLPATAAITPPPQCLVPDFVLSGTKKNSAAAAWSLAGFTGGITYSPNPSGNWTIISQSPAAGSAACTSALKIGG